MEAAGENAESPLYSQSRLGLCFSQTKEKTLTHAHAVI